METFSPAKLVGVVVMATGLLASASLVARADGRVALVVGNSAYAHVGELPNVANDVTDMSAALKQLGFEVTAERNLGGEELNEALRLFGRRSSGADVSLVFYAGHGLEIDGANYLVPVDARLELDTDVEYEAVPLDRVIRATAGSGLRLVILDACRNNPLAQSMRRTNATRTISRGSLAEPAEGLLRDQILVAYAAEAGRVARDGTGQRNSPYTAALLRYLTQPLELHQMFRRVRADVLDSTGEEQRPFEYGALIGDHYLREPDPDPTTEILHWQTIAGSLNPGDFEVYLQQWPNGQFAPSATTRLRDLRDAAFWNTIAASRNPADLEAYLQQWPTGQYASLASSRLRDLRDTRFWEAIAGSEDPADFRAYLDEWPDGQYVPLATNRIRTLAETVERIGAGTDPRGIVTLPDPTLPAPGTVLRDCSDCPELVVLPPGTFRMGSTEGQLDEQPVHQVRLRSFALGRHEVTRRQFQAFVRATGHTGDGCNLIRDDTRLRWVSGASWSSPGFNQGDDHPVVCVSWEAARTYVQWLSRATGERYRLPSEAEWEYAARAETALGAWVRSRTQCDYANGADRALIGDMGGWPLPVVNCSDGASQTAAVGSYTPNAFNLFDMLGNVWEWTADCLHDDYGGAPNDGSAWTQAGDCRRRILRGGSWDTARRGIRSANRYWNDNRASNLFGFRVAREVR